MFHQIGTCTSTKGNALPGWFIECVRNSDLSTVIPIYADENLTPVSASSGVTNRAIVDADGNYEFFVDDGTYGLKFYDSLGVYQRTFRSVSMYGTQLDSVLYTEAEIEASEAIAANDFVNYDGSTVRLAIASDPGKFATGFAPQAIASGATGKIRSFGQNAVTVATGAAEAWLSDTVPGGWTATAPTDDDSIKQPLGSAIPGYGIFFNRQGWSR